jgi:hypothetical protein
MALIVNVPLVIAKRADGTVAYVYSGAPLPTGLAEGEYDRLAEYVIKTDEPPRPALVPKK